MNRKQDIRYILIITASFSAIIAIIMLFNKGCAWGSETDWISQHYSLPEYFRTRFYETGDLFPDFAPQLGGGQNIYNFSYYGLFNPVYLPAYIMPWVTMADYIQVVSIISVLISCILCYFFMKKYFSCKISFYLTFMFMCAAPLIFHSHRHIMFINYLPFLFVALFAAGNCDNLKNRALLIISSYCILCSSFYFSIGAFLSIIIYSAYTILKIYDKISFAQLLKSLWWRIICIFLGCITAGILWVPTIFTLLSGREQGTSFINILKLMIPVVNLHNILYGTYSIGLTAISVIAVIVMLKLGDKATKLLAVLFAGLVCFPFIIYLCNGTMYLDSKVLIPFLPLLLILCGEFFVKLFSGKVNPYKISLVFITVIIINLLFNNNKFPLELVLIADSMLVIATIFLFSKFNKKEFVLIPVAICSIINCISVNLSEKFVPSTTLDAAYSDDIQQLVDKTTASDTDFYRFANSADTTPTVNRIFGNNFYTTNVYSSVSNSNYRQFRFDYSASENSCRNNAISSQPKNEIFNILMGCKYRIDKNNNLLLGETEEARSGEYSLYRNNYSFPVGYASDKTMSEECFEDLNYASKVEALLTNIIIPENTSTYIPDSTKKLDCGFTLSGETKYINEMNGSFEINSDKIFSITASLNKSVSNSIVLVKFRADNRIGKKSERDDIWVSINDVKNKLSDPEWKYNNQNYEFTYVLSSNEDIQKLEFEFSQGNYLLSDFEVYTLDKAILEKASSNVDEFVIDCSEMGGDTIQGSINVTQDGWFNLSVPYDKGFEILIDNVKTDYFKTNTAFIGFPIKAGEHNIVINYNAPFRTTGLIMSVCGGGISICMMILMYASQRGHSAHRKRITVSGNRQRNIASYTNF